MPSPHDRDVVLAGPIRSMTAVLGHRAGIAHCLTFTCVQKLAGLPQVGGKAPQWPLADTRPSCPGFTQDCFESQGTG